MPRRRARANGDGSLNPSTLTYGATLQYSLLYRNSHVEEVPEAFRKLIPAFEAFFTTPVANRGPTAPGNFPAHTTTGVFGPSLYYVGAYFEVGVMAQFRSIAPAARMSARSPSWISSSTTFSRTRWASRCSRRRPPAPTIDGGDHEKVLRSALRRRARVRDRFDRRPRPRPARSRQSPASARRSRARRAKLP